MPRKKETLTLSVPSGTKERLESIAQRLGILWGNNPSASGLVSAIAQQTVEVGSPFTLSAPQVKAFRQSIRDLIDAGHSEEAKSVITLLLDRGELEPPLRQELIQQVSQSTEGFRLQIDQYIVQRQPFHLVYQNSQGQILEFMVRYAEVIFYEKRFYLQIWCDETQDSTDLPELRHNRCLRLDRIQGIVATQGEWRGQFDTIFVHLHFYDSLVSAYEAKLEDIENTLLDNQVRQVVRRVVNPFWLIREVLRYGKDCELVSPDGMRHLLAQEIQSMYHHYH
jgi:predicted DNA-binding transcriptional regulator YafY